MSIVVCRPSKIFQNLCMSRPALLQTVPANQRVADANDYGALLAERVMCLMSHLRRLRLSAKKLSECQSSMVSADAIKLESLLSKIDTTMESNCQPSPKPLEPGQPAGASQLSVAATPASKRKGLPRLASEMFALSPKRTNNVGSDRALLSPLPAVEPGTPLRSSGRFVGMFSPGMLEVMKEAEESSPVPPKKKDTRQQAVDAKADGKAIRAKAKAKAKGKAKAKAKAKAKSKGNAKAKARSQSQGAVVGAIAYKVTLASQQSYIQVKDNITKKLKLWVAVGASMSENHQDIIREIKERNPATKEQALEMRATILGK